MKFNVLPSAVQFRNTKLNVTPRILYTLSCHGFTHPVFLFILHEKPFCPSRRGTMILPIWNSSEIIPPINLSFAVLWHFVYFYSAWFSFSAIKVWCALAIFWSHHIVGLSEYLVMSDAQMYIQRCVLQNIWNMYIPFFYPLLLDGGFWPASFLLLFN